MKNDFNEFIENLCILMIAIFIKILVCFVNAFIWAVPMILVWNKIITGLCGFNEMTYFQAYWICVFLMAFLAQMIPVNTNKN